MRERLFALLGGAVSLLLVLMILTPLGQPRPPEISAPTTVDRGDAGLSAMQRWLDEQGVPTSSHREPLTALPGGGGSLLVMSLPGRTALAEAEVEALWRWVERGNHLILLTAYGSAPQWRALSENGVETALNRLGLSLGPSPPVKTDDLPESGSGQLTLRPTRDHPLTRGVDRVVVPAPAAALPTLAPAFGRRPAMALLGLEARPVVWWVARGAGTVVVSAYTGLFSHNALAKADNARLAANLVGRAVADGGRVIFDDYRFGLETGYDPEAFYGDPRLHLTLLFIGAFWVLYAVGHRARLGPARPPRPPSTARQFVEGVASLLARRIPPAELRERLWRNLVADLHRRYGKQDPWTILAASPTLPPGDLEAVRTLRRRCERGAAVNDEDYARTLIRIRELTL